MKVSLIMLTVQAISGRSVQDPCTRRPGITQRQALLGSGLRHRRGSSCGRGRAAGLRCRALFDPDTVEDPILRKAVKEPVAFFGGMFAGFLGLSTVRPDAWKKYFSVRTTHTDTAHTHLQFCWQLSLGA